MSLLVPIAAGSVAIMLLYGRIRRLSARPQKSYWGDPRPRALAESLASALTVLIVGRILATAMAPAPAHTDIVFTMLAVGVAVSQFAKSIRAPRALITARR